MMADEINSPSHYTAGGMEPIEMLEAKLTPEQLDGYLIGTALVYLMRANFKGDFEKDVRKANWYTARMCNVLGERRAEKYERSVELNQAASDFVKKRGL